MEELTMQLTGAQLPLQLLMSWLDTDGQSIKGWDIRSENAPAGRRIYAQRNQPLPPLQLTLLINSTP
jgi:outer membrane biogenesis lipoprotein LolB